jgi:hypothetical protein
MRGAMMMAAAGCVASLAMGCSTRAPLNLVGGPMTGEAPVTERECAPPDADLTNGSFSEPYLPAGPCEFQPSCMTALPCRSSPLSAAWTCECAYGTWQCVDMSDLAGCALTDAAVEFE